MGAAGSQNNRLVETLSGSLEAAKSEISALRSKLDKLKSSPIPVTSGKSNDSVNQCWSDAIIQQLRGEVDQLQSQIDTEKFQRFATEDDLIKAERKLADAERQRDELAAVNYRLSVQLEDIKCRSTPTENHRSAKVLVETLPADHGCQKENSPKKKGVKIAESLTVYSATGDSTSKRLSQIGLNSNSSEEKISRPKGRKVLTNIVDSTCENTLISNDNCNQQ